MWIARATRARCDPAHHKIAMWRLRVIPGDMFGTRSTGTPMPYDPIARTKADAAATTAAQALLTAQLAQAETANLTWTDVSADTVATPGQRLSVNTATGPVTVTLPAEGGTVSLRDDAGTWGINPCTVFGNGVLIGGQASFALNAPGFQVTFSMVSGAWRYTTAYMHGAAA